MIFIKVRNGLGNQMFEYAFGEFLKGKCPKQVIKFDYSDLPIIQNGRVYYKINDIFKGNIESASYSEIRKYCGHPFFIKRMSENQKGIVDKFLIKLGEVTYLRKNIIRIYEPNEYWNVSDEFVEEILKKTISPWDNYYFTGFWEDIRYIYGIRSRLYKLFEFKKETHLFPEKVLAEVEKKNSVAVHIRRGDYLQESMKSRPKTFFNVCTMEYYGKAIDIIKEKVQDPFFIFFSDDFEYVEYAFADIKEKFVVKGFKDYEDMQLMSMCKHSILANSTFSFWAAFLNPQKKVVIAPKIHYIRMDKNRDFIKKFFVVPDWIYIDNGKSL